MKFEYGAHKGKEIAFLLLGELRTIHVLRKQREARGWVRKAQTYVLKLIRRYNDKPYLHTCSMTGCKQRAIRATHDPRKGEVALWCHDHRHASPLSHYEVSDYRQAASFDLTRMRRSKRSIKGLTRFLAEAKGLAPGRLTPKRAREFFGISE